MSEPEKIPGRGEIDRPAGRDMAFCFAAGIYFALLQFSYFFLLEVFLSSRAVSFFVAVFFWLIGFLIGLNLEVRRRFPLFLGLSCIAYYGGFFLIRTFPYQLSVMPAVGALIAFSGSCAGAFFPYAKDRFPRIKHLFLHENNGFILGIALSLVGSVWAGRWLLSLAPLFGVAIMGAVHGTGTLIRTVKTKAERRKSRSSRDGESTPSAERPVRVLPLFLYGMHFGVVQIAVYFLIQVYVTASFMGYFAVVLAWMAGVVVSLRFAVPRRLSTALFVSTGAYFGLLGLTSILTPYLAALPLIAILVGLTSLPAGAIFRVYSARIAASSLFFHENNGFVLGYLLSMFGFVKWGVNYLQWAPLLSLAVVVLGRDEFGRVACVGIFVAAGLCLQAGSVGSFFVLLVAGVIGTSLLSRTGAAPSVPGERAGRWRLLDVTGRFDRQGVSVRTILLVSGFNLIFLQYFLVREFSSILAASEVTIVLVGTAYFAGFSIGYGASRFLGGWILKVLSLGMFFLHLGVIFGLKFVAGFLIDAGYGAGVLIGLLLLGSFGTAAFYSMFLPRFVDRRGGVGNLVSAYSWELGGAALGVVVMFILASASPGLLIPLYFCLLLGLIGLVVGKSRLRPGFLLVGAALVLLVLRFQGGWLHAATEDYYQTRGYSHPKMVFSGNSVYHSVEVIETYRDEARTNLWGRHAFINGVRYFSQDGREVEPTGSGATGTTEFTYFLAELPAKYLAREKKRKLDVLILGCGSMYSVGAVQPYASRITLVEIDPLVIESAREAFSEVNQFAEVKNLQVVIDDAKHYLRTCEEEYDLIINDISAPYYLGTALLHGVEFYEIVKERLDSRGIFSESTQGRPNSRVPDSQGMKILRGVADTFPRYRLVDVHEAPRKKKSGYVYASKSFPLSSDELDELMKEDGTGEGTEVHPTACSHFKIHRTRPFSLGNMETLFSRNTFRMMDRLGLESSSKEGEAQAHVFDRMTRGRLAKFVATSVETHRLGFVGGLVVIAALFLVGLRWTRRSHEKRAVRAEVGLPTEIPETEEARLMWPMQGEEILDSSVKGEEEPTRGDWEDPVGPGNERETTLI